MQRFLPHVLGSVCVPLLSDKCAMVQISSCTALVVSDTEHFPCVPGNTLHIFFWEISIQFLTISLYLHFAFVCCAVCPAVVLQAFALDRCLSQPLPHLNF